jgi:tetratricopeptide (TPR) repeat protein/transcriptional regulator with XRE-family HTH domain
MGVFYFTAPHPKNLPSIRVNFFERKGTTMPRSSSFTTVVNRYVARALYTAGQLANLTGVSKETIANWLEGKVRKPRQWRDLVKLARALHLNEAETTELLKAAGHLSIAALLARADNDADRALLAPWNTAERELRGALQRLAQMPLDHVPEPAPLPSGSRMPLSRNWRFTGRVDDLLALARLLKDAQTVAIGPRGVAGMTGMGGIGKTQLASAFVHRYGQFFAGGVFWLSFADPGNIPHEIVACGGVGFMDLRPDFASLSLEQQVQVVRAAWQSPLPRLLVFDNCEDEALLAEWQPTTGGCHVLLTSRRSDWDPTLGVRKLPLQVLHRPESTALLRSYRDDLEADDQTLDAIARELGDLPLALHLAGAYLFRYRAALTPTDYLHELRSHLLNHRSLHGGGISPTMHTQHVARTFDLSFERLDPADAADRLAIALLARSAVFAHGEPISHDLLLATLDEYTPQPDVAAREHALARLIELGLLERSDEETVRIHRLLAAFVQQQLVDDLARHAVEHVVARRADDYNELANVAALRLLLRHLRHMADTALPRRDADAAHLAMALGQALWLFAQYDQAEIYLEQALRIFQQQAEPHPLDIAGCYNLLGLIAQLSCRFHRAQSLFEQALAIWEQELGHDHETTASEKNNLGYLLLLTGAYSHAKLYLRQSLRTRKKLYGLYHPGTARSINNVGYLLQKQGHYHSALRYLSLAHKLRAQLLPSPHLSTAMTLNFLGEVRYLLADYDRAEQFHRQALEMRRAIYGDEHHDLAESLYNLARVRHALGDYAQAHRYIEPALALNRTALGDYHRETAFVLGEMGRLLCDEGQYSEARRHLEWALAAWENFVGLEHPETATALDDLGALWLRQGDYPAAQRLFAQALDIRQSMLDAAHPDLACSYYHLGLLHTAQGDCASAQQFFIQALSMSARRLGANHSLTRTIRTMVAPLRP